MENDNPYHEEIQRMKFWGSNQDPEDQIHLKEELEKNVEPNCFECHHPRLFHRVNDGPCHFHIQGQGVDGKTKMILCQCKEFDNSNLTFFKQISENEKHNEEVLKKWREEHPGQ